MVVKLKKICYTFFIMIKNLNTNGLMNAQDALVAIMVAGGASDENISNRELISISRIVDHLPIFKSYDPSKIKVIAETVFDLFEEEDGLDALFGLIKQALRQMDSASAEVDDVSKVIVGSLDGKIKCILYDLAVLLIQIYSIGNLQLSKQG